MSHKISRGQLKINLKLKKSKDKSKLMTNLNILRMVTIKNLNSLKRQYSCIKTLMRCYKNQYNLSCSIKIIKAQLSFNLNLRSSHNSQGINLFSDFSSKISKKLLKISTHWVKNQARYGFKISKQNIQLSMPL